MPRYLVTWAIDAEDFPNAVSAAKWARMIQLDPGAQVGSFTVVDAETGKSQVVDITPDQSPVWTPDADPAWDAELQAYREGGNSGS